jgi:hypothetical protein
MPFGQGTENSSRLAGGRHQFGLISKRMNRLAKGKLRIAVPA